MTPFAFSSIASDGVDPLGFFPGCTQELKDQALLH